MIRHYRSCQAGLVRCSVAGTGYSLGVQKLYASELEAARHITKRPLGWKAGAAAGGPGATVRVEGRSHNPRPIDSLTRSHLNTLRSW